MRAACAAALAVLLSSCARPLPDADSPNAKLYASRCGICHAPHQPHALTPAMWKVQVHRMDQKFRDARLPVPTDEQKKQILDYLTSHAGG
jgi:hypothetical protein